MLYNPAADSRPRQVVSGKREEPTLLVIGPDASMSPALAAWFFASLSAVSLATAGVFVANGLWPVLPFAGLELAAVGAALLVTLRRNRHREVVSVAVRCVTIEIGQAGQGPDLEVSMRRSAARAFLEGGAVVISGDGHRVAIGRCLRPGEREALCRRLKELFTPAVVVSSAGRQPESQTRE